MVSGLAKKSTLYRRSKEDRLELYNRAEELKTLHPHLTWKEIAQRLSVTWTYLRFVRLKVRKEMRGAS